MLSQPKSMEHVACQLVSRPLAFGLSQRYSRKRNLKCQYAMSCDALSKNTLVLSLEQDKRCKGHSSLGSSSEIKQKVGHPRNQINFTNV